MTSNSMLSRQQKTQQIEWIKEQVATGKPVVYLGYRGVKIVELDELRNRIGELGGLIKVVKTRLLKKALLNHVKEQGGLELTLQPLPTDMWDKPIALIIGNEDSIALAKTITQFVKDHAIGEVFGGRIDSATVDRLVIKQLASLPGREELLVKVVGSLMAPIRGLVWALSWNQFALISVIKQYHATF